MAYTPELQLEDSRTLRRIAWALGMPMTKAMHEVFLWLGRNLDAGQVCSKCKDPSKCQGCLFNRDGAVQKS